MLSTFTKDLGKITNSIDNTVADTHKIVDNIVASYMIHENNKGFSKVKFKEKCVEIFKGRTNPSLVISELKFFIRNLQKDKAARVRTHLIYNLKVNNEPLDKIDKYHKVAEEQINNFIITTRK